MLGFRLETSESIQMILQMETIYQYTTKLIWVELTFSADDADNSKYSTIQKHHQELCTSVESLNSLSCPFTQAKAFKTSAETEQGKNKE